MKLKNALLMLALLLPMVATAEQQQDTKETILFDTGKSEIKASEEAKIEAFATIAKVGNSVTVIVGHTDKRGGRLFNLKLGEARAEAVRQALVKAGVREEAILVTVSYGKEKPAAPNDNLAEHLAANRRVELKLVSEKTETKVIEVKKADRKNRISLSGGVAPIGLDKDAIDVLTTKVTQDYAPSFGLTYTRKLNDRLNVGASVFTNNSYYLNLGLDF